MPSQHTLDVPALRRLLDQPHPLPPPRHSPTAGLQHTNIIPTTPTTVRLFTASHGWYAVNAYLGCPPFFLAHGEAAVTTESLRRARTGQFCAHAHKHAQSHTQPPPRTQSVKDHIHTATFSHHTHPQSHIHSHTQSFTHCHTVAFRHSRRGAQKQPLRTRTRRPRCSRGGVVVSRPLRRTSTAIASPSACLPCARA